MQKVPALLDEVHRLIETRRLRFVLSGSSARKLRRGGRAARWDDVRVFSALDFLKRLWDGDVIR